MRNEKGGHISLYARLQGVTVRAMICLAVLLSVACEREFFVPEEDESEHVEGNVLSTLCFNITKGQMPNNNVDINRVKTVRVLLFDVATGRLVTYTDEENGIIRTNNNRFPEEGYFSASSTSINLTVNTAPGTRHIYFVANEESDPRLSAAIGSTSLTHSQFKALMGGYVSTMPSEETPFIMTAAKNNFTIALNNRYNIAIELVRTYTALNVNFALHNPSQITVNNASATAPAAISTSTTSSNFYSTLAYGSASQVTIDSIVVRAGDRYFLIPSESVAAVNMISAIGTKSTRSVETSWTHSQMRQRQSSSRYTTTSTVVPYSTTLSRIDSMSLTCYIPEYIPQNEFNRSEAMEVLFYVSEYNYSVTALDAPDYTTTGTTPAYTFTYEEGKHFRIDSTKEAGRTFVVPLGQDVDGDGITSYKVPRNYSYNINAQLSSALSNDSLFVETEILPWTVSSVDVEMAPVCYDWGKWISATTCDSFISGEHLTSEITYGEIQYFGIKLTSPIGKRWRITLSDGYSFEFTEDSETTGIATRNEEGVYVKFGITPCHDNTTTRYETYIHIMIDDEVVSDREYKLIQNPDGE